MRTDAKGPDTSKPTKPLQGTGSRYRRSVAFWGDLLLGMNLTAAVFGILALVVPPDSATTMLLCLMPGLVVGFGYFAYATPLLGNSLYKRLFGLRVVSHTGAPISWLRWAGRALLTPLWMISGIIMLVSPARRHLADWLAGTRVDWATPTSKALQSSVRPKQPIGYFRTTFLFVVGFLIFNQMGSLGLKLATLRMPAYNAAKQHLVALGHRDLSLFPSTAGVLDDSASFVIESGDELMWVKLARLDGKWEVQSSEATEPWSITDPFTLRPKLGVHTVGFGHVYVGASGSGIQIGMR